LKYSTFETEAPDRKKSLRKAELYFKNPRYGVFIVKLVKANQQPWLLTETFGALAFC